MSLAEKVAASRKMAKKEAEEAAEREIMNNRYIAKTIMKAKKKGETPFPSNDIESLAEIAQKVVAKNFSLYPHLSGVTDKSILEEIIKQTDTKLPLTTTARNINFEFYWEQKCLEDPRMKNVKKEEHGNSYK
jgi:hypothetical protein